MSMNNAKRALIRDMAPMTPTSPIKTAEAPIKQTKGLLGEQ